MTPATKRSARTSAAPFAADLRLACMRIARRVRFESGSPIAPHQFSVLVRVEESPMMPRELAAIERVSAPSMSRTVASLADCGLVSRTDDPEDGRSVIVSITDAGRAAVREQRRRRDLWFAQRLGRLTAEEQDVLRRATEILTRVAAE
jgi:DNA-binding MarR family transcriptional regulator